MYIYIYIHLHTSIYIYTIHGPWDLGNKHVPGGRVPAHSAGFPEVRSARASWSRRAMRTSDYRQMFFSGSASHHSIVINICIYNSIYTYIYIEKYICIYIYMYIYICMYR